MVAFIVLLVMKTAYDRTDTKVTPTKAAVFAIGTTVALFLVVPLTNYPRHDPPEEPEIHTLDTSILPPPSPPLEPPPTPEDQQKQVKPELADPPPPMTLAHLDMTLRAGPGDVRARFAFGPRLDALDEIRVFDHNEIDRQPVAISQVEPVHPYILRRNRVSGSATVEFVVDEIGNVRDARAIRFTHKEFGDAAVDAVRNWKFRPGEKDGNRVRTRVRVPINFRL